MRKALKFLHSLASCGLIGALVGYGIVLIATPQDMAGRYADARQIINALCNYMLLPSLALALVTGLLSMAVHRPFQELRWVWAKAALGLSMFESTLGIIQSKADYAAGVAAKVAAGDMHVDELHAAVSSEWTSLGIITALAVANVALGVWRPRLKRT